MNRLGRWPGLCYHVLDDIQHYLCPDGRKNSRRASHEKGCEQFKTQSGKAFVLPIQSPSLPRFGSHQFHFPPDMLGPLVGLDDAYLPMDWRRFIKCSSSERSVLDLIVHADLAFQTEWIDRYLDSFELPVVSACTTVQGVLFRKVSRLIFNFPTSTRGIEPRLPGTPVKMWLILYILNTK